MLQISQKQLSKKVSINFFQGGYIFKVILKTSFFRFNGKFFAKHLE